MNYCSNPIENFNLLRNPGWGCESLSILTPRVEPRLHRDSTLGYVGQRRWRWTAELLSRIESRYVSLVPLAEAVFSQCEGRTDSEFLSIPEDPQFFSPCFTAFEN